MDGFDSLDALDELVLEVSTMYVGRILGVGRNKEGHAGVIYRVSSRSFPNRLAQVGSGEALILPRPGHEGDMRKNPYIAYRCLRVIGGLAVATNGSQTDAIAEKAAAGMPLRDAMASVLLALDFEKDDYATPRIAAAIRAGAESGFLGVVRRDGLEAREIPLPRGQLAFIATYEINSIDPGRTDTFEIVTAEAGARYAFEGGVFAKLTHPVASVCALQSADGFALAAHNFD